MTSGSTSHAKLDLRKMLGLVTGPAKRATKGHAKCGGKRPAKKVTVTVKKSLIVTVKGASINGEGKVVGRS